MCEALHQRDVLLEAMKHSTDPANTIGVIPVFRQITHHAAGGRDGISLTIGKPGEGDGNEDIVVRIKADAPLLWPDATAPANPVL